MTIGKRFFTIFITILLVVTAVIGTALPVFAATYTVTLSNYSGAVNSVLYAYATTTTTFAPGTFAVYFSTYNITGVSVGAGLTTFNAYFGVPVLPRGAYNVTITNTVGDTQTGTVPVFTITPQIFLTTNNGHIGDQLTISGNGFAASTPITIYLDGVAQAPTAAISTDAIGQFSNGSITIPTTFGGVHTITAWDNYGSSPGVSYTVAATMTLSAATGAVGSSFTVTGSGFAANTTPSFLIDGTVVNVGAVTDATGKFTNATVVIPTIGAGLHTLTVQDTAGHVLTQTFTVTSTMSINPTSGPVDTTVTVTGSGFLASKPISITYDSASVSTGPVTFTSDSKGSFSTTFKIPAGASGVHVIKVSDGTNSGTANFTTSLTAKIDVTSGPVGTSVTANGTGFKGNSSVTIIFNGIQNATATTDGKGNLATTFTVKPTPIGSHVLVLTDGTNTKSFDFTVSPTATIDSAKGNIGSSINVSGSGFGATQSVTVKYDNNQIATSSTDAAGTFTVAFKAPVSKGGAHTITVTDGTNTKTFDYAIDSTPPSVPALTLPANDTRGDKIPTLSWQDVTDANGGIVYDLQLSKDIGFNTILLEKDGLTSSTYTFSVAETLKPASKKAPYYWRVKAIDAASSESAWSTPSSFFLGFVMPTWGYYAIGGVAAVILLVGGFFLGNWFGRRAMS